MSEPVTAYAAARVLRRDRQTVVRVTDRLHPDAFDRHGRPLWRVERVAAALVMTPQERREAGKYRDRYSIGRNKALDGLRLMIERQIVLISAELSRDRRRERAVRLAPQLAEYQSLYITTAKTLGIANHDVIGARSDLIWSEMMDEVSKAAQWPRDGSDFFAVMFEAMWPNANDDEVA